MKSPSAISEIPSPKSHLPSPRSGIAWAVFAEVHAVVDPIVAERQRQEDAMQAHGTRNERENVTPKFRRSNLGQARPVSHILNKRKKR